MPVSELADVPQEEWPLARFAPSPEDVAVSAAVALFGLLITAAIARFGRDEDEPIDERRSDDDGVHGEPT